MATTDDDNVADAVVARGQNNAGVYLNILPTDGTDQGIMDFVSNDEGGFTCIMDDADPAQNMVFYIAMGSSSNTLPSMGVG